MKAVPSLFLAKPRKQPTPFLGESDKDEVHRVTASHPSLASGTGLLVPWSHVVVTETGVSTPGSREQPAEQVQSVVGGSQRPVAWSSESSEPLGPATLFLPEA